MQVGRIVYLLIISAFLLPGLSIGTEITDDLQDDLLFQAIELYNDGKYNASKEIIDRYLSHNGENVSALNIKGLIQMNTGDHKGAQTNFLKALEFSDNHAPLYYNLGLTSFYLSNMEEADEYFSKARACNTSSFELFFYSGLVKYALGSYNEAVELLDYASILNPNDSATWFNLGMSYEQIKKFDLAVKAYDNAIDIDPKYEKPWFFKGRIFQSFGNDSFAIMSFENYTSLAPKDDLGWFFYAKSLHDNARNNESIRALRKAIDINPSKQMYTEFLSVYESNNQSTPNELIFGRPSDNLTIFILVIIFIMGGCAIYRK